MNYTRCPAEKSVRDLADLCPRVDSGRRRRLMDPMTLHMRTVLPEAGSRRSLSRLRSPGFMTPALIRLQPVGGFNPIRIHAVPSLPAQVSGSSSEPIAYVIMETAHQHLHRRKQAFFSPTHSEKILLMYGTY